MLQNTNSPVYGRLSFRNVPRHLGPWDILVIWPLYSTKRLEVSVGARILGVSKTVP